MDKKTIDIFPNDYEALLLRAGEPNKIAFVVRNLVDLSNAFDRDKQKLEAWKETAEKPKLPI